jgi:hypothetical protein
MCNCGVTYYYIQVHIVPLTIVTHLINGVIEGTMRLHQILHYPVEKCYPDFQILKVVFGEQIMERKQVFEWFSTLKRAVTSAEGLLNALECPLMSKIEENVYRLNLLVLKSRKKTHYLMKFLTCWEFHLG